MLLYFPDASHYSHPPGPGGSGPRVKDETRLLNHLMQNYDKEVRPVYDAASKVVVNVGITLTQIFDMVGGTWYNNNVT